MDDTHQRISHLLNEAHRLSGTINERAAALERQRAADHAMVECATTALRQCQEKLQRVEGELQKVRSEYSMLERLRTYDLDRCAEAHKATLQELAALKLQLSKSSHDMDTDGICGARCPACARIRDDRTVDAGSMLEHLRTCPPNMCREGHPEIRYSRPAGSALGCPLCRVTIKLSCWEKTMPCGHPEVALIVDDPPHCGVCDLLAECKALTFHRLQGEQRDWVAHNFPLRLHYHPLLGAVEELGELAHAHLKWEQGIRGTPTELEAAAKDAIADVVIYLADYCSSRDFDFQALMEDTWSKVKARDWKADPATGGSGELSRRQEDELSAQREKDRYTVGTHANC